MKAMQAKAQGKSNIQTKKKMDNKVIQAKKQGKAKVADKKMGSKMPDTPFQKEVRKSESDKKKKVNKVKNLPSNPKAKAKMRLLKKKAK